ncbi:MAG: autotransporter outer membrane beta-barrel domain-containing protein [Rhodospirillales bacterium]|nr:autotransporter outer membrane beta-barrel domain-containing protein [Rhodospirillales bacterium]
MSFKILGRSLVLGSSAFLLSLAAAPDASAFTEGSYDAYSCSDATYGSSGTYWLTTATNRTTYSTNCTYNNTSNTSGAIVTAGATLRAATVQTVSLISSRIKAAKAKTAMGISDTRLSANQGSFGLSGGNADKGVGVWVQGAFTKLEDSNEATKFDGTVYNGLIGADYEASKTMLVGLAVGYEKSNLDTDYNLGDIDGKGFVVSPYISIDLNKNFSIDATVGYSKLNYDTTRKDASNSTIFSGETDGSRVFGTIDAVYSRPYKDWTLGGSLGALYSKEDRDAYTETGTDATTVAVAKTSSKLGQARLGASAAYTKGKVQPYIGLTAEYDFTKTDVVVATNQTTPADDNFGLGATLGLNLAIAPNITGTIQGNTMLLRENYSEHTGLVRLRVEF